MVDSFLRGLGDSVSTEIGALKLKDCGLVLTAAAAADGLTVTNGAEKVKAGRDSLTAADVTVLTADVASPTDCPNVGCFCIARVEEQGTAEVAAGGGGNRLKLGRFDIPSGIVMGCRSEVIGVSCLSSRRRADSRTGADILLRILPPAFELMGVLATGAAEAATGAADFDTGGN